MLDEGEAALSVNWLEYFGGTVDNQVAEVRSHIHQDMNATGVLAQLNVCVSKSAAAAEPEGVETEFVSDPQACKSAQVSEPGPIACARAGAASGQHQRGGYHRRSHP